MTEPCTHFHAATIRKTKTDVCQECIAIGASWVHLRLCMTCGHVGCCDTSPNKHATAHFKATRDPVIRSVQPGESWAYCFVHELFVEDFDSEGA